MFVPGIIISKLGLSRFKLHRCWVNYPTFNWNKPLVGCESNWKFEDILEEPHSMTFSISKNFSLFLFDWFQSTKVISLFLSQYDLPIMPTRVSLNQEEHPKKFTPTNFCQKNPYYCYCHVHIISSISIIIIWCQTVLWDWENLVSHCAVESKESKRQ